jgi:hypothetical protein
MLSRVLFIVLFAELGAEAESKRNPIPQSILFNRKVTRRWSEESKSWYPCELVMEYDPFILIYLDSTQFAEKIASRDLKRLLGSIKQHHPGYTIVFLIQGLDKVYSFRF